MKFPPKSKARKNVKVLVVFNLGDFVKLDNSDAIDIHEYRLSTKSRCVNLHATKGTKCVMFIDKFNFDSWTSTILVDTFSNKKRIKKSTKPEN